MTKDITLKLKVSIDSRKVALTKKNICLLTSLQLEYVLGTLKDFNSKDNVEVNFPKLEGVAIVGLVGTVQNLIKTIEKRLIQLQSRPLNYNRSLGWRY